MSHPTTPREQFQEAVMGFRKAAYEFGMADNAEDHETMLMWQRSIFALYDEAVGHADPVAWRQRVCDGLAWSDWRTDRSALEHWLAMGFEVEYAYPRAHGVGAVHAPSDDALDKLAEQHWRESRYSGRDGQDFDHRAFARAVLAGVPPVDEKTKER